MVLFLSSLGIFFVFFFFFFSNKDFLPPLVFPYFSISKELPRVNFVKCAMQTKYGNNVKKELHQEFLSQPNCSILRKKNEMTGLGEVTHA